MLLWIYMGENLVAKNILSMDPNKGEEILPSHSLIHSY